MHFLTFIIFRAKKRLILYKSYQQTSSKEDISVIQHPRMKIQLPLENWTDLLPFVPRRQLVEIIKQLGDRQFAKILQFFLTEVGQITIGHLRIVAPRENDPKGVSPIVEVRKMSPYHQSRPDLETNLPEGPMPTNVKDFKLIELSYFDESVANFLHQFQQEQDNFLLDNVNLCFYGYISLSSHQDNTIMQILARLMPIIGNINSMSISNLHHMGFGRIGLELEPNNAASQLLTTMLISARILEIYHDMDMSTFSWCNWLYAPRNDEKPRALRLSGSFPHAKNLIERIKKDFSKATRPVSFFVYVRAFDLGNVDCQDICLDNDQTNERMMVKTIDPLPRDVLISRYPVGAHQQWIEANEQEIVKWDFDDQNRRIGFDYNLKFDGTQ